MEFYQPGMREKVALDKEGGGGGETERCFCNLPLLNAWSANVFFTHLLMTFQHGIKIQVYWDMNGILEMSS